jgi:hypothetical protein
MGSLWESAFPSTKSSGEFGLFHEENVSDQPLSLAGVC